VCSAYDVDDLEDLGSIGELAYDLANKGYHIIIGDIDHDGNGGSTLSNFIARNKSKFNIDRDDIKIKIGD
jgi:hypothetical protein